MEVVTVLAALIAAIIGYWAAMRAASKQTIALENQHQNKSLSLRSS